MPETALAMEHSPVRTVAVLAFALALSVSACRSSSGRVGSARPLSADTAVVQVQQEPDSLDPYISPMSTTSALASLFYSGLLLVDDKGRWMPDLATVVPTLANGGVHVDARGMRVTYHLREGVTWHDGQPFTAADVAATYRLITDPRFPSLSTAGYDRIRGVETPDAHTVTIDFREPYAPYLELLPYVLPAHGVAATDHPEKAAWNRAPVGTGPYVFSGWSNGDRLIAKANPNYFRGAPAIHQLEARFITSDITAFNLWRSGELDLFQGGSPTQYDFLQREVPDRVHLTATPTWEHLLFNLSRPALADVRVRRAIAHLIDRHQLNEAAYGGVFQPAWSEVPPTSWAYDARLEHAYPPSPQEAARLLDEAGWKRGPDGVRLRNGQPLSLRLLTTTDKPSRELAAQLWRRQWRDAGISLTIEKLPAAMIFGSAASGGRLATGDFDLALVAGLSRPDPDTSFRWRSDQLPPNGQNRARYRSATVDRLLREGQRTVDVAHRRPIYLKLAQQLNLDLPVVPLLYWVGIDTTSQRLSGYRPNPTLRGNLWNAWEWKLKSQ